MEDAYPLPGLIVAISCAKFVGAKAVLQIGTNDNGIPIWRFIYSDVPDHYGYRVSDYPHVPPAVKNTYQCTYVQEDPIPPVEPIVEVETQMTPNMKQVAIAALVIVVLVVLVKFLMVLIPIVAICAVAYYYVNRNKAKSLVAKIKSVFR